MVNRFTGNKDTDFLILAQLEDRELTQICQVNTYVKNLCEDDMFWKTKVISIPEIFNLSKEYLTVGVNEDIFREYLKEIKDYLEFPKWKDFYIFLRTKNINYDLRESIVRFLQIGVTDILTLEHLNRLAPNWINVDVLLKELRREFFIGYGRGDGLQGTVRIDKISRQINKFINTIQHQH